MGEIERIKKVAKEAAREAGKVALRHMGKLKEVTRKSGATDLVTDVDKECERIIIERVKKEFPSHSILAEESGESAASGEYQWFVDPLDGTTNYTHSFPVFCASIGVKRGGEMKVGIVYDPVREELFEACAGEGAFLNDSPIKVSLTEALQESLLATGFAYNVKGKIANLDHFAKMLEKAQAVRRLGSAALDLCYVACGRLDGFWELGLRPWDTAAGQLIVQEAGGKITAFKGGAFDLHKEEILATNGRIHDEMIKLLTQA